MSSSAQDSLFSPAGGTGKSATPTTSDAHLAQEREFALDWIMKTHGSPADFIKAMEKRFGSSIRMYLIDILDELRITNGFSRPINEYLSETLSDEQIAVALGERLDRPKEMPSLDELFARSRKLQSTDKYVEAMRFCAKFRNYSPFNNLLVYVQNPETSFWATASHWKKKLGRSVKDDARAMVILAPMTPVLFVYDVVDTEGPELPQWFRDPFEVKGDFSEACLARTMQNCERLRIQVAFRPMGMTHGGTAMTPPSGSKFKIRIELKQDESTATSYATLCHELAHIFLGHLGGDEDGWWVSRLGLPRLVRELEAESVAWLVCARAGLRTKSAEYLAGYLQSPEQQKLVSIDMVAKAASKIEDMGERLLPVKQTKAEQDKEK